MLGGLLIQWPCLLDWIIVFWLRKLSAAPYLPKLLFLVSFWLGVLAPLDQLYGICCLRYSELLYYYIPEFLPPYIEKMAARLFLQFVAEEVLLENSAPELLDSPPSTGTKIYQLHHVGIASQKVILTLALIAIHSLPVRLLSTHTRRRGLLV